MYTSDNQKRLLHYAAADTAAALFFAFFGAVYEYFSHEVYSAAMIYAFAIPLLGGVLPELILLLKAKRFPGAAAMTLWHCALAAWTIGTVYAGVLEIYGTTNQLAKLYLPIGALPAIIASVKIIRNSECGIRNSGIASR